MSFKQVGMYPKLHSSIHFQYHITSRIIVSLVVLALGCSRSGHLDDGSDNRKKGEMSNVSLSV